METIYKLRTRVANSVEQGKRLNLSEELKKDIVSASRKLPSGMTLNGFANIIGVNVGNITLWRSGKKLGVRGGCRESNVAFKFGDNQIRLDVRTKCIAVKDYLNNKGSQASIGKKLGVSNVTVGAWIKKFKHNYMDYIDAPDGIPYIVKEENILRGLAEIDKARQLILDRMASTQKELDELKEEERAILEKRLKEL